MARKSHYMANKLVILQSIHGLTLQRRTAPSVREVAEDTEISMATLHSYLQRLHQEGLVQWRPKRHRSLQLTKSGQNMVQADLPF